jgi:hypothetical protein
MNYENLAEKWVAIVIARSPSTPLRVVYPELDEGLRTGSSDEAISWIKIAARSLS